MANQKRSYVKMWKYRLQKVRLRTKILIPMIALAVIPAIAVGFFTIFQMQESLLSSAIQRVEFDAVFKAQVIQEFLKVAQQDLKFLSQEKEIRDLVAAESQGSLETVDPLRRKAERKFLSFSQGKRAYYQVRYMNIAGHEVLRLYLEDGLPKIVPQDKLQDKRSQFYVKAALTLEPGEIYVSHVDLNVEYRKADFPYQGVIRYVTQVSGTGGKGRGLLMLNIYIDQLLSLIEPPAPGTEAWLVDQKGTYIGYVGESEERRVLFSPGKGRKLSLDYTSEEIRAIDNRLTDGKAMKAGGRFLSKAYVSIDRHDMKRGWTLMIAASRAPIEEQTHRLTTLLLGVMTVVVFFAAVLGVLIGNYFVKPIERLQRATQDIATGDLEKQVHITTGDEIERLANDFNAMTEKLREAQERLSQWNLELKQEVDRQTGILQKLQSGMARADKLASIGQITAGVMHEVGNPLTAIKTKIQVAEEDSQLSEKYQDLLREILGEVDRLAAFLQSFSRLGMLGDHHAKKEISLSDVALSVINLVSADLRRKGVDLIYDSKNHIPNIYGVADQLRQLLMNLILNAADASKEGDKVLVSIKRIGPVRGGASDNVCLKVQDYGKGISSDILDNIWNPFFTTKNEGTGLGLAVCKDIIQNHGGEIRMNSEQGKGTVVEVIFPTQMPEQS
jgi:signal transduction histidine kinase